jgi:alpha-tubulin suppressor-like RCC1 family protein
VSNHCCRYSISSPINNLVILFLFITSIECLDTLTSIQVQTGYYSAHRLDNDGSVASWGGATQGNIVGNKGQLVGQFDYFKSISCASIQCCGIKIDDTLKCWGDKDDYYGVISLMPTGTFKEIYVGQLHACGIQSDTDLVKCWGNKFGYTTLMVPQYASVKFKHVSCGQSHTCAIKLEDDTLVCWGISIPSNNFGQATVPNAELTTKFKSLSAAKHHTCAIRLDDTLVCWGVSIFEVNYGQINIPTSSSQKFKQVAADELHTCAIKEDGAIICWGYIVPGTTIPASYDYNPTISPGGAFSMIDTSGSTGCGVKKSDNTVVCWGESSYGALSVAPYGCLSYTTSTCATCHTGYNKINSNCVQDTRCIANKPNCGFCSGENACAICSAGFEYIDNNCIDPKLCLGSIPDCEICSSATMCNTCKSGSYLTGNNTCSPMCFGLKDTNTQVCSSRGTCISPDQCQCNPTFTGSKCEATYCYKVKSNSAHVCSGHGTCSSLDNCKCTNGYAGYQCQRSCSYCNIHYKKL